MKSLKIFVSYFKPHKKLFFIDMVCALIVAISDLFYPVVTKDIINIYIPNRQIKFLLIWGAILLVLFIIKMLLNYVIHYWGHIFGVRIQGDMRRDLFAHLQKLPFTFFDENKTGSIMSRIITDLFEISELAHHGPEDLFLSIIMLIGTFIMLIRINVWLTIIIFFVLPFVVFFAVRMRTRMHNAFKEMREKVAELNANVEASISGIRVAKSYTASDHEIEVFNSANELFKTSRKLAYRYMAQFHSVMTFFTDFLYLGVLIAGGLFFYFGKIDIGQFVAYLLYVTMFLKPVNRLISLFEQLQEGMTGLNRFIEIMNVPEEQDSEDAIDIKDVKGDIRFENVSFKYKNNDSNDDDDESMVISGLSLDIESGRKVALVGPSGGGKTTLCHLIPRFYELNDGRITIDGYDITKLSRKSLRQNIGIVAQDVFLFNDTIRANIEYGRLGASEEEIIEAAKKANIHDFIMSLEKGYDTNVGERGVKLSGGQKQRISIARVFLKNPSILILDEATSALDNQTEMLIQASFEELSRGRTSIIVAHRLSTVKNADEIIVLTSDGIAERGTHEELMESKGLYSKLYNYQFKG